MFTCPIAGGILKEPDIKWFTNEVSTDIQHPGFQLHPAYSIQDHNLIVNATAINSSGISVRCQVTDSLETITASTFMQLQSKIINNDDNISQ